MLQHSTHTPLGADHADVGGIRGSDEPKTRLVVLVAARNTDHVRIGVDGVAVEHLFEAPAGDAVGLGESLGVGELRPVVDHLDREAAHVPDCRERLPDVPGADDQQRCRPLVHLEHHLVHRSSWSLQPVHAPA